MNAFAKNSKSLLVPAMFGSLLLSSLSFADPGTWKCSSTLISQDGEEQTELSVTLDPLKERPFVTPGESATLAETPDLKLIINVGQQSNLAFPTVGILVLDKKFQGPEGGQLAQATAEESSRIVTLNSAASGRFLAKASCFRQ